MSQKNIFSISYFYRLSLLKKLCCIWRGFLTKMYLASHMINSDYHLMTREIAPLMFWAILESFIWAWSSILNNGDVKIVSSPRLVILWRGTQQLQYYWEIYMSQLSRSSSSVQQITIWVVSRARNHQVYLNSTSQMGRASVPRYL